MLVENFLRCKRFFALLTVKRALINVTPQVILEKKGSVVSFAAKQTFQMFFLRLLVGAMLI